MINIREYWESYLIDFEYKSFFDYICNMHSEEIYIQKLKLNSISTCNKNYNAINNDYHFVALVYMSWGILLQRLNNTIDILFGTIQNQITIGNILPFRFKFSDSHKIIDILKDVEDEIKYRNEALHYNSTEIINFNQLDTIIVVKSNSHNSEEEYQMIFKNLNTKIILDVDIFNRNINLYFNKLIIDLDTIQSISKGFQKILSEILSDIEIYKRDLDILTEEETKKLLNTFNNTYLEYPRNKTINSLFEEQVERTPHNTAIICGDKKITYTELNEKANQLANILRKRNVTSEVIVGLVMERSIDMIVGLLGILKAGGAYLPSDPSYPIERIHYMLENGKIKILITQNELKHEFEGKYEVLCIDEDLYYGDTSNIEPINTPNNLIYVLYTSGSTGKPKGVMVEHRNVVAYIHAFKNEFKITEQDRMLQQSTCSFDIYTEEVYPILMTGGTLVIAQRHETDDINKLVNVMRKNNITIISGFPYLLNELNKLDHPIHTLHTAISGGDVLRKEFVSNLAKNIKIYNTYGPSETTVCVTYYHYTGKELNSIPLGKPISNYNVYILDKKNRLMPIGIPGELCISGAGVTRGYLNKMELTEKCFVTNPFNPNDRLYKSGDLARWLPDGSLEFFGRIDNQVKIGGRRTEPEEVEKYLLKYDSIEHAVVLPHVDSAGMKYLCAYTVSRGKYSVNEIKKHLSKYIPDFMIPEYFVQIKKLPITPNGKIDKYSLPIVVK